MGRIGTSVVLVVLLFATAAAMAITEKLKLEKSPVFGTLISDRVAPTCGCATAAARIRFKLRRRDRLSVTILDAHRRVVDTLATDVALPAGVNIFHWTGSTDQGGRARDGTYYVELHLVDQHRTLLLPNRVIVDTVPPWIEAAEASPPAFSPDGDHRADSVEIRYGLGEPAFVLAYLRGRRIVLGRFHRREGGFSWGGSFEGRLLAPGTYTVTLAAVDLAGNVTPVGERARVRVTLRYITLAAHRFDVRLGGTLGVGVSTDATHYRWRLGNRSGPGRGSVMEIRAPRGAGRYRLLVTEHGHDDRAVVIVSSSGRGARR